MADTENETITPDGQVKKELSTHELLGKFLDHQKLLIEKFDRVLERSGQNKRKDIWDVIANLSGLFTFFSSVVIALVGIYFTNAYKRQDVRITEAQTVEKFLPFLNSQNVEIRKGALLAVYGLQDYELAARLAASYAAPDNIDACEVILKTAKDDAREQLTDALVDALKTRVENERSNNSTKVDFEELIRNYDRIFQLRSAASIQDKRGRWYVASIYTGRGNIYRDLKYYDKALADYKRSLEIYPEFSWAFESIGLMHSFQNNFEPSIENIKKAIELQPTFGQYYADLGEVYVKQANLEKDASKKKQYLDDAEEQFTTAVEKEPNNMWLHSSLAYFYLNNGRSDKAGYAFQFIYHQSKDEAEKTAALYQLQKIYPQDSRIRNQEASDNEDSPSTPEATSKRHHALRPSSNKRIKARGPLRPAFRD